MYIYIYNFLYNLNRSTLNRAHTFAQHLARISTKIAWSLVPNGFQWARNTCALFAHTLRAHRAHLRATRLFCQPLFLLVFIVEFYCFATPNCHWAGLVVIRWMDSCLVIVE